MDDSSIRTFRNWSVKIEPLSEENVKDVYEFCERNCNVWSQPFEFFKRTSLNDSNFNPNLTLVVRLNDKNDKDGKNNEIIAFFQGTRHRSLISPKKHDNFLKFFIVGKDYRNKGLGTYLLNELIERFKNEGYKGILRVADSAPDYWWPGLHTHMTQAYIWLKKNGFTQPLLLDKYRIDLLVDLENNEKIAAFIENPVTERNGYKILRVNEHYREKTKRFVSENFSSMWVLEYEMGFQNDPPTTYIAVDINTDEVKGFATYNAHHLGSFGPTGVLKSLRGKGIGSLLLKWCLKDMKDMGLKRAYIKWIGPIEFYSKSVNAYMGQFYFPMKMKLK